MSETHEIRLHLVKHKSYKDDNNVFFSFLAKIIDHAALDAIQRSPLIRLLQRFELSER
jgi:hypothetical protein